MPAYPSGHENKGVAAIIFLMDDWLNAIEDDSYIHRLPNPVYPRRWTDEELNEFIIALDNEVGQEVAHGPGTSVGAQAGTDFVRLPIPQRRALAQQLHNLFCLYKHDLVLLLPHSAEDVIERYPLWPDGPQATTVRWPDGTFVAQIEASNHKFVFADTPQAARDALESLMRAERYG